MELLQLKYFREIVESGSFSKAAKKFGIGLSSISQTMKHLENEIGLVLFERYSNRIKVSESGVKYYNEVKKALDILDDAKDAVSNEMESMCGNINICIYTNRRIAANVIEAYHCEYPEVTFTISHKLYPSLLNDATDEIDYDILIADVLCDEILCDYDKELLISEKILLATNNRNRILRNKKITSKILATQNFITMSQDYSLYNYTHSICRAMGFVPKVSINCDDTSSVRRYIEMGFGVSFVPEISWKGQFNDMIVLRDVGDFERETYLYLRKNRFVPKRLRIFIDYLKQEFDKYSE